MYMKSLSKQLMSYALALLIGLVPVQSAMASFYHCDSLPSQQTEMSHHNMAHMDDLAGQKETCPTCLDHGNCCTAGACSASSCSLVVGILADAPDKASDPKDIAALLHQRFLLPQSHTIFYRPPRV
jgi:ABC-type uncharacterized transport system YnjBCD permease subunit